MNTQLPLVLAIIVSSHGWYRVPALHLARALFRREWLKGSVPIAPAFGSRTPLTNFWPGLSLWSATISSFFSCTTWLPAQDSKFRMCVYICTCVIRSLCVCVCLSHRPHFRSPATFACHCWLGVCAWVWSACSARFGLVRLVCCLIITA